MLQIYHQTSSSLSMDFFGSVSTGIFGSLAMRSCVGLISTILISGFKYIFFITVSSPYFIIIFLPLLIYIPGAVGLPLSLRPSRSYQSSSS